MIEPEIFGEDRGFLVEFYNQEKFTEKRCITNFSHSKKQSYS
ncbi:MAG: hypothetical protein V7K47_17330 [Nostoc sp.]